LSDEDLGFFTTEITERTEKSNYFSDYSIPKQSDIEVDKQANSQFA
jgi:hypothetical protein